MQWCTYVQEKCALSILTNQLKHVSAFHHRSIAWWCQWSIVAVVLQWPFPVQGFYKLPVDPGLLAWWEAQKLERKPWKAGDMPFFPGNVQRVRWILATATSWFDLVGIFENPAGCSTVSVKSWSHVNPILSWSKHNTEKLAVLWQRACWSVEVWKFQDIPNQLLTSHVTS